MISLSQLQQFLDDYLCFDKKLDIGKIDPYMTNGLMVKGKEEVKKIGFGVSASLALFEMAKKSGCDAIITHHSFNFPPFNCYDSLFQSRFGFLVKSNISLFGYHFLLDAHPIIGNNSQILKHIGANLIKPFYLSGSPWGWMGEYHQKKLFSDIVLQFTTNRRMVTYNFGPKEIKKVVAISGQGAPHELELITMMKEKIDLFITGEAHEWIREQFREAHINFIAAGHYHTEVFGVKALMEKVKEKFPGVETKWIELSNDI